MPHVPQETHLLNAFCYCNVLGFTRGECGALLRAGNPFDGRTPAHHSYTRYRLSLRILGGIISGVRVNYRLETIAPLEQITVATPHHEIF